MFPTCTPSSSYLKKRKKKDEWDNFMPRNTIMHYAAEIVMDKLSLEVLSCIVETFPPRQLAVVRAVNSSFRAVAVDVLRYRVNALLAKFFPAPAPFLSILKATNALVGGSCALSVLSGTSCVISNIDIFVPQEHGYPDVLDTYLENQGYSLQSTTTLFPSDSPSPHLVHRRLTYAHLTSSLIVHVWVTTSRSALAGILDAETTITMNAITPFGILSLYPMLTFSKKGVVNRKAPSSDTEKDKYVAQNFRFPTSFSSREKQYLTSVRDVHDRFSLFFPFCNATTTWYAHGLESIRWVIRNKVHNGGRLDGIFDYTNFQGRLKGSSQLL
ncbi:hypothetical protein NP233_g9552 [Leucocoprinus birnbaumii]|uniref:F-box domain-containing protein n=1 Tax=Leucocoprinus birnbaumii TaxID=56174 RepID=A0AAD5YM46_9AGAR|nr:hypothetical protein NP233_g9552 [Leucocoprinus birnbaumii]